MFVNCFYKIYFGNVLFPKGASCRLLCFSTHFLQQLFVFETFRTHTFSSKIGPRDRHVSRIQCFRTLAWEIANNCMVITDNPIKVYMFWKLNKWASQTSIIFSQKQIQVHDNYHTKDNNIYRYWQETKVQNKNISLSLNKRHITVLFSKRFKWAASKCYESGHSTKCSVHWLFGGKSAKTSKMPGSIISISSSELAASMFSKSEMSTSFWLRRLNSPAVGISEHSRVNCYR